MVGVSGSTVIGTRISSVSVFIEVSRIHKAGITPLATMMMAAS